MQVTGKHQRITEVLREYWEARYAAAFAIPTEAEIDPEDFGDLWQHCFLVQKLPDGRFQYVHMGDAIIEAYGDDVTGHEVCGKLVGELHDPLSAEFREVIGTRQPLIKESAFINKKQMEVRFRTCLLPLRRDTTSEDVEYILGGMKWKAY
jgi:hypothetical protein